MTGNLQIMFACCFESGWLEDQTVWMIESLRRWGEQLANSLMSAVTLTFVVLFLTRHTKSLNGYKCSIFVFLPIARISGFIPEYTIGYFFKAFVSHPEVKDENCVHNLSS